MYCKIYAFIVLLYVIGSIDLKHAYLILKEIPEMKFYKNFLSNYIKNLDRPEVSVQKITLGLLWILAVIPHLLFVIFYAANNITPMIILNIFSVMSYIIIFIILYNNKFLLTVFCITFEVIIFCVITVIYMGAGTNIYLYLMLIILPFYFYIDIKITYRTVMSFLIVLIMAFCLSFEYFHTPLIDAPGLVRILNFCNPLLTFAALILEIIIGKQSTVVYTKIFEKKIDVLAEKSNRDPLTNLYNRRYAEALFMNQKDQGQKICVGMLDIDDFKKVNDIYGHDAGDLVLKRIADTVKSSIREDDAFIRWGGEEFLLVLNNVKLEFAKLKIASIIKRCSEEVVTYNEHTLSVTLTAGVAEVVKGEFAQAITNADTMLYEGKHSGKNCVMAYETERMAEL